MEIPAIKLRNARTAVEAAQADLNQHLAACARGAYKNPLDAVKVRLAWCRRLDAAMAELRAAEAACGLWR